MFWILGMVVLNFIMGYIIFDSVKREHLWFYIAAYVSVVMLLSLLAVDFILIDKFTKRDISIYKTQDEVLLLKSEILYLKSIIELHK